MTAGPRARGAAAVGAVAAVAVGLYWVFLSPYSQFFGRYPWRGRDGARVVALTFDGGPNEPYPSHHAEVLNDRGVIIIFHDGYNARGGARAETVEAVRMTVEGLLHRGYRFVTVDQLLGVPAYGPRSARREA